ncbi:MAG: YkgJ family cysteine cluster protein [Planctomycetales bacterium]|nr:YkgJ family cysteine cluster protein [Planctomycetales bacterium]
MSKKTSGKRPTGKKTAAVTHPCKKCTGRCCRYFALPIDTPQEWDDFDDIRWYLSHEDVTVFVEKGDWYLNVKNTCRYLCPKDFRCRNYELRPHICRKYNTGTCDLMGDEYDHEMHFLDDRQMEEYMRIKFGPRVFEKLEPKKRKKSKTKKILQKRS